MALVIDASRAFRRIQELVDLVGAVVLADPNDESDWVEWKAGRVLANKDSIVQLSRHILGMANRKVIEAARSAEGCGYVIVGAEPGTCDGVTPIDPADLDSKITTYVGADGPSWSPQHVPYRGIQVLVITVEPPRWGQGPFTLRKAYENYNRGAIFVRRPGHTLLAQPEDVEALVERYAAASQPFTLQVRPASADGTVTIHALPDIKPLFDEWATTRRRELNPAPSRPATKFPADPTAMGFVLSPAIQRIVETANDYQNMFTEPDPRSDAKFQKEVNQYIQESWDYFRSLAISRQAERGDCVMFLELINGGERTYADLHVEVQLSGLLVAGNAEDLRPPGELPAAPDRRGARRYRPEYRFMDYPDLRPPFFVSSAMFERRPVRPALTIGGSPPRIKYELRELRAEKTIRLPPVILDWDGEAARTLEASWTVTAANADGVARGKFTIAVGEPSDLSLLLPELQPRRRLRGFDAGSLDP